MYVVLHQLLLRFREVINQLGCLQFNCLLVLGEYTCPTSGGTYRVSLLPPSRVFLPSSDLLLPESKRLCFIEGFFGSFDPNKVMLDTLKSSINKI